jgi:hypothetical protein
VLYLVTQDAAVAQRLTKAQQQQSLSSPAFAAAQRFNVVASSALSMFDNVLHIRICRMIWWKPPRKRAPRLCGAHNYGVAVCQPAAVHRRPRKADRGQGRGYEMGRIVSGMARIVLPFFQYYNGKTPPCTQYFYDDSWLNRTPHVLVYCCTIVCRDQWWGQIGHWQEFAFVKRVQVERPSIVWDLGMVVRIPMHRTVYRM